LVRTAAVPSAWASSLTVNAAGPWRSAGQRDRGPDRCHGPRAGRAGGAVL